MFLCQGLSLRFICLLCFTSLRFRNGSRIWTRRMWSTNCSRKLGSHLMPRRAVLVRVAVAFAAAMPGALSFSIPVACLAPLHRPSLCRSYTSAGRIPVIIPCDMLNSFLAYKPPDADPWKRAGTGLCNCTVEYVMHDAFLCAREYVKQSKFMTAKSKLRDHRHLQAAGRCRW